MSENVYQSDHVRRKFAEALQTLDRGEGPILIQKYRVVVAAMISYDDYQELKRLRAEEAERLQADRLAERIRQQRKKAPRLAKLRRRPRT